MSVHNKIRETGIPEIALHGEGSRVPTSGFRSSSGDSGAPANSKVLETDTSEPKGPQEGVEAHANALSRDFYAS